MPRRGLGLPEGVLAMLDQLTSRGTLLEAFDRVRETTLPPPLDLLTYLELREAP
jgi:hypothetical protein